MKRLVLFLMFLTLLAVAVPSSASAITCNSYAQQRDGSHSADDPATFINGGGTSAQTRCFHADADTLTAGVQPWGSTSTTYNVDTGGTSDTARKVIAAAPGESTYPTLQGRYVFKDSADNMTVTGLRFTGNASGSTTFAITELGSNFTFDQNNFSSVGAGCINVGAWTYTPQVRVSNFTATRNRVHDCGSGYSNTSGNSHYQHGFYLENLSSGLLRLNLVYRNNGRGTQTYPNADGVTIDNSVYYKNGQNVNFSGGCDGGCAASDNVSYYRVTLTNPQGNADWTTRANAYTSWDGPDGSVSPGTGNSLTYTCAQVDPSGGADTSNGFKNTGDYSLGVNLNEYVPFANVNAATPDFTIPSGDACRVIVLVGDIQTQVGWWPNGPPND